MTNNYDGEVLIGTKIDTDGVDDGSKKIKKKLEDVADESKKQGDEIAGGLSNSFSKMAKTVGPAIASAFAADKLIEFGAEAINLGSDLQEVQNVVDVTFSSMSDAVNDFARDASASAGLSETMAKKYVGTLGAMAKSFGFTEQEAFDLSKTLTQLTGDVASFYNLSQDEAYNKLKSVFTGETESLKELGVVMTQTALDAYAMENGFGKVTAEMSEQEKVSLRYQFVLDQLEGATGDFVRTQESWANQTKMLSLQWESFQATMGQGLITALTPALIFINEKVMPVLQQFADDFSDAFDPTPSEELRDSMDTLRTSFENAETQLSNTTGEIEVNAAMAKSCADELKRLEDAGLDTTESHKKYEAVVKRLNAIMPGLNLKINAQTGYIDQNTDAIYANIDALKERAIYEAAQERYTELTEEYKDAAGDLFDAELDLIDLESERAGLIHRLADELGISTEQATLLSSSYADLNGEVSVTDFLYKELFGTYAALNPEASLLLDQLSQNTVEQNLLNQEIANGNVELETAYGKLDEYYQKLSESKESAETAAEGQGIITEATGTTITTLQELRDEYDRVRESARESIDQQISMFDELTAESDKSALDIITDARKTITIYSQYGDNLQKLVDRGLPNELASQWSDFSEDSIQKVAAFAEAGDLEMQMLISAFEDYEDMMDDFAPLLADIETETSKHLEKIREEWQQTYGEDIPDDLEEALKVLEDYINGIEVEPIVIDVVTRYTTSGRPASGGSVSSGISLPGLSPYSVDTASYIPYLATGAVIPPNAPFTAVLGDQRNGYNLEGPEDMFRSIVQEETSGTVEAIENVAEALTQIIGIISSMNIDGYTVFDIVKNEQMKQNAIFGKKYQ